MFKLILARHGECDGNKDGIFRGRLDFPLNPNGLEQSKDLAQALANLKIDYIYTSPLERSLQTAKIVSKTIEVPFSVDEGFNGIFMGPWEGMPKTEIEKEYPHEWKIWTSSPEDLKRDDMESIEDVGRRSCLRVEEIRQEKGDKTILVVSHRTVIKTILSDLLELRRPNFWKMHIDNCSYSIFHFIGEGYMLFGHNYNAHLRNFVHELY